MQNQLGDNQSLLAIYQSDLASVQWEIQMLNDDLQNDPGNADLLNQLQQATARAAALEAEIAAIGGNPNYQSNPQNVANNQSQIYQSLQNTSAVVNPGSTSSGFLGLASWQIFLLLGVGGYLIYDNFIKAPERHKQRTASQRDDAVKHYGQKYLTE